MWTNLGIFSVQFHLLLILQRGYMPGLYLCFYSFHMTIFLLSRPYTELLFFLQLLFGILMVFYLPSLDPYPGYTPIRNEVMVDNTDYEPLPGGEHICPERHANIFSSE
jgi:hypothetical protein